MTYQVISKKVIKRITFERGRIEFITNGTFIERQIQKVQGLGGYFFVSSPELTAIDLVRYPKVCGHLNNIATILEDLKDKWDGRKMISMCHHQQVPTVTLQRLGYILDCVLDLEKEADYIRRPLKKRKPVPSLLVTTSKKSELKRSNFEYNKNWNLYINSKVEPD